MKGSSGHGILPEDKPNWCFCLASKHILTEDTSENAVFEGIKKSCFAHVSSELEHNISDFRKHITYFSFTIFLKSMLREKLFDLQ